MDAELEKIALSGSWADRGSDTLGDEIKEDTVGDRRKYVFYCPYCDNEFVTDKRYRVTGNVVSESVKTGCFWKIQELIWETFYRIPVIGHYLGERAERKLEEKEDRMEDRKDHKTLLKAFEEVKDNFVQCSKCGRYTCESCMQENVCGFCRDGYAPDEEV